jgi:hypothetical protein
LVIVRVAACRQSRLRAWMGACTFPSLRAP